MELQVQEPPHNNLLLHLLASVATEDVHFQNESDSFNVAQTQNHHQEKPKLPSFSELVGTLEQSQPASPSLSIRSSSVSSTESPHRSRPPSLSLSSNDSISSTSSRSSPTRSIARNHSHISQRPFIVSYQAIQPHKTASTLPALPTSTSSLHIAPTSTTTTTVDRETRRRERNRMAASRYRMKQGHRKESLEQQLRELQHRNVRLLVEERRLRAQLVEVHQLLVNCPHHHRGRHV